MSQRLGWRSVAPPGPFSCLSVRPTGAQRRREVGNPVQINEKAARAWPRPVFPTVSRRVTRGRILLSAVFGQGARTPNLGRSAMNAGGPPRSSASTPPVACRPASAPPARRVAMRPAGLAIGTSWRRHESGLRDNRKADSAPVLGFSRAARPGPCLHRHERQTSPACAPGRTR